MMEWGEQLKVVVVRVVVTVGSFTACDISF
jgi:hypothetical protein